MGGPSTVVSVQRQVSPALRTAEHPFVDYLLLYATGQFRPREVIA